MTIDEPTAEYSRDLYTSQALNRSIERSDQLKMYSSLDREPLGNLNNKKSITLKRIIPKSPQKEL